MPVGIIAPRLGCLVLALGASFALFVRFCDLVFDCGCRGLFAGSAAACNIHHAAAPHCPWCVEDGVHGQWAFALIIVAQVATCLWPGRVGPLRALLAVLAFPAVGAAGGLAAGILTGYWD